MVSGVVGTITLFVVGFYVLVRGAQTLIKGAVSIAKIFKVSGWLVGVVIVGIGTSIPEFSINLASVFNHNQIGISTIIGSNTFNILMILGLSAIISPLVVRREWVRKDMVINFLSVVVSAVLIYFPILGNKDFLGLTRQEGLLLLVFFSTWLIYMITRKHDSESEMHDYKVFALSTSLFFVVAGIIGVFLGGRWVVEGTRFIAEAVGIHPAIIGLTLISVGTSLPELTVSIVAAFNNKDGIAVGNVVGSNIFDFLGILGIVSVIRPIELPAEISTDIIVSVFAPLVLLLAVFAGKKKYVIGRWQGFLMVVLYTAYMFILYFRI